MLKIDSITVGGEGKVCVHTMFFQWPKHFTEHLPTCASDSRLYYGLADGFLPEPCEAVAERRDCKLKQVS